MEARHYFGFIVLLVVFASTSVSSTTLDLVKFDDSVDVYCNDGSSGGYYFRPAAEDASAAERATWILHQQGGGWCWDDLSCVRRIISNAGGHLVSSNRWPETKDVEGLFQMEGTEYERVNLVYMPYCTSDAHMGAVIRDLDFPIEGEKAVYFHGRLMSQHTIRTLVGEKEDQTIVFGGLSAGGRGAVITIDQIKVLVHPSTTIRGLIDSAGYEDVPGAETADWDFVEFGEQCRRAYDYFGNLTLLKQGCVDEHPGDVGLCMCSPYNLPFLDTPSMVVYFVYEGYQMDGNLGENNPSQYTEEMCSWTTETFLPSIENTIGILAASPNHSVFSAACKKHGLVEYGSFNSIAIDGVTAQDVFLAFMRGEMLNAVSECRTVNCEQTCTESDLTSQFC